MPYESSSSFPPHLYVNSALPLFLQSPFLKSGTLIFILMQHFCDNLSFLLCVGWWKNKGLPFICNVMFKKWRKPCCVPKKTQCCLYEIQTTPLDKIKFYRQNCNFSVPSVEWDEITVVSATLFVSLFSHFSKNSFTSHYWIYANQRWRSNRISRLYTRRKKSSCKEVSTMLL